MRHVRVGERYAGFVVWTRKTPPDRTTRAEPSHVDDLRNGLLPEGRQEEITEFAGLGS